VASVARVERDAAYAFARILCQPAAGVDAGRFVLVLATDSALSPYPEEAGGEREKRTGKRKPRTKAKSGDPDAAR
jgi:rod shape-determining protein MreC